MTFHVERDLCRSIMRAAYRRSNEQVSPITHVVGFWVLLSGAACLFSVSVFFPMWQEHRQAIAATEALQARLDALRTELNDLNAVVGALGQDPVINERVAVRELNYYIPGQEVVATSPGGLPAPEPGPESAPAQATPSHCHNRWWMLLPPNWLSLDSWSQWVCQRDVRRALLLAAAFLVSAAFILFAPPAPRSLRHALVKPR